MHRSRRSHRKFGWPEFWFLVLVASVIGSATIWWQQHLRPKWRETAGVILEWQGSSAGANAKKANVTYEYTVGLTKYTGKFDGFWPEMGTPNAIARDRIGEMPKPGAKIVVYYDPNDDSRSDIMPHGAKPSPLLLTLSIALACAVAGYTFVVYPAWRK
ncbi:MAG TPA: DUF3592 domain-containing protein [Candidatus Hydrogenedentes bacterium]|nr:DUF3592 domain-containing protein [Candidatus Hydrogenedentota bacterium]HRK34758.1 DUF3592 domain-containing protein [Candidatus Hydrogenedentota bacterium]